MIGEKLRLCIDEWWQALLAAGGGNSSVFCFHQKPFFASSIHSLS
jgi:hypothetical protein